MRGRKSMGFGRFEDFLKKQLKNARFRKGYERELRTIRLAHRILTLRQRLGLTQRQLAGRMRTTQQAVARLESGRYEGFTLRTLERVAEALGAELVVELKRPARKSAV